MRTDDTLLTGMGTILNGQSIRDQILRELRPRVQQLTSTWRPPGLAVVLAGNDPGSEIYVRNKVAACGDLGIYSDKITPSETVTTAELLAIIDDLNHRPEIDGILVQMPLPKQVDSRRVLEAVAADKDADGFHPTNVGHLVAIARRRVRVPRPGSWNSCGGTRCRYRVRRP